MADQTKYTNKVHGQRILVSGGTSGIGYAVAEALLESGAAQVILASSNQDKVNNKIKSLQASYPSKASRVSGFTCNLSDRAALEPNIKTLLDQATNNGQNKLDHIVHTAGDGLAVIPVDQVDLDKVIQAGMVRYFSTFIFAKFAKQYINPGPKSSITLTTGTASERPLPGWGVVVGFATALQGVTRGLALDLAPLRVNLVSPGAVDTELWDTMGMSGDQKKGMLDNFAKSMPTGRVAAASDIAESYLLTIKDQNMTGTMVSTNGGVLLMGPH